MLSTLHLALASRCDGHRKAGRTSIDALGQFQAPHGISLDSEGSIYVGEVSYTNWPYTYGDEPKPKYLKTLQKLERVLN